MCDVVYAQQNTNPLVQSFLLEHPKHRYSVPFIDREKYPRLQDYLELAVERLSDETMMDFRTRFTFCEHPEKNHEIVMTRDLLDWGKYNYFSKRTSCDMTPLGIMSKDSSEIIISGDGVECKTLAKKIARVQTYHYYNASVMFAGVIGEVVCQLPTECFEKNNDRSYYIFKECGIVFGKLDDMHVATLSVYERVDS